jgi:glycosyltransferase involved in cell wall biosynthesis
MKRANKPVRMWRVLKKYARKLMSSLKKLSGHNNRQKEKLEVSGTARYEGHFDGFDGESLNGWMVDSTNRSAVVSLAIVVDGVQHLVSAGLPRSDLIEVGIGAHAFKMKVDAGLMDGRLHEIILQEPSSSATLLKSPYLLAFPNRIAEMPAPLPADVDELFAPNALVGQAAVISVVIPTYERSQILLGTLERIRQFMSSEVEIIVINDGSRDDTAEVLRELAKTIPRLRTETVENGGPGRARNIGAEMASGQIILFLGDDTRPRNIDFFRTHLQAHRAYPAVDKAVLGKIALPNDQAFPSNAVMSIVHGEGQQQFGFKYMNPWEWYDWRFFYTSNVSMKKGAVQDWDKDGFDRRFYLAAFEDGELAYRITKRHPGFSVFYVPTAVVDHYHHYTLSSFMNRQVSVGLMMDVLLGLHPELEEQILGSELLTALHSPLSDAASPIDAYIAVVEGLRAWATIIDAETTFGSQNWHAPFLDAVLEICKHQAFLSVKTRPELNYAAAYKVVLAQFERMMAQSITTEMLGRHRGTMLVG